MPSDLGITKSVCILATVLVCFGILWPSIFYPMLKGALTRPEDDPGCCDILLEKDVDAANLIRVLCNNVLRTGSVIDDLYTKRGMLNKVAVSKCRDIILDTCYLDINLILKEKVKLGYDYKNVLKEMRTVNNSLCLKYNFGVTLELIGVPHRLKEFYTTPSRHIRQERPLFHETVKNQNLHPALKHRGRTMPESTKRPPVLPDSVPQSPHHIISSMRKPPIPGMRPPMGGGHMPQQKGSGGGLLEIIMPMYTIGIVLFFAYTIIRLLNKKQDDNTGSRNKDDEFKKTVFNNTNYCKHTDDRKKNGFSNGVTPSSKIGEEEIVRLRRRLAETEAAMDRIIKRMSSVSQSFPNPQIISGLSGLIEEVNRDILERETKSKMVNQADSNQPEDQKFEDNPTKEHLKMENVEEHVADISKGSVHVLGMETTESCEGKEQWTQNYIPSVSPKPVTPVNPPYDIILAGKIPSDSQVLITEARTDTVPLESSVILESKVTLSVIPPEVNNEINCDNENLIDSEDDSGDENMDKNEIQIENIVPKNVACNGSNNFGFKTTDGSVVGTNEQYAKEGDEEMKEEDNVITKANDDV